MRQLKKLRIQQRFLFEWVVYFLIVFIPLEEFLEKWIPNGIFYEIVRYGDEVLLILVLTMVLLGKLRRGHFSWKRTPLDFPLLIFLGVGLLSTVINLSPPITAILGIRSLIRYVLVYYIVTQLRVTEQFLERCFSLSLTIATLVAFIGLLQTLVGSPLTNLLIAKDVTVGDVMVRAGLRQFISPRTYIFSTMGRYDTLGTYLMFFLLLAIGSFTLGDKRWRRKIIPFLLIGFPAIVLTFSRQSWFALIIGVGVMLLISKQQKFRKIRLLYILGLVFLAMFIAFNIAYVQYYGAKASANISVSGRILEVFSPEYFSVSRFSGGRLYVIIEVGSRLLKQAPLFGLGPGQFGSITARFLDINYWQIIGLVESAVQFVNDVDWIVILGQVGLFGVLAFLWMFLSLFWSSYKQYIRLEKQIFKGVALAYSASIIAYLVLGFFGPNFEVRQISFFIWLFGGLIVSWRKNVAL